MSKIRNCFLIVCMAFVVCLTVGANVIYKIGIEFPSWLAIGTEHSFLEGRDYDSFPELSLESILSGDFQDGLEDYVADKVPMRDEVILTNAALQRLSISTMAYVLDYDTYPTFFDSGMNYSTSQQIITRGPWSSSAHDIEAVEDNVLKMGMLADSHPQQRFFLLIGDSAETSPSNIAYSLVRDKMGPESFQNLENLSDENFTVKTMFMSTIEEYKEQYYSTDHHWNGRGAYAAYLALCNLWGLEPVEIECEAVYSDPQYHGSAARYGLDVTPGDSLIDLVPNLSEYTTTINGEQVTRGHREEFEEGTVPPEQAMYNAYSYYYGSDVAEIIYHNPSGDGTLVLLGDSFKNSIDQYLIANYEYIYVIDYRYKLNKSLKEYIEEKKADDVIFLFRSRTLWTSELTTLLNE